VPRRPGTLRRTASSGEDVALVRRAIQLAMPLARAEALGTVRQGSLEASLWSTRWLRAGARAGAGLRRQRAARGAPFRVPDGRNRDQVTSRRAHCPHAGRPSPRVALIEGGRPRNGPSRPGRGSRDASGAGLPVQRRRRRLALGRQTIGRPARNRPADYTGSAIRTIPAMASATAATCARESRSSSRSHAMTTVTAG